MEQLGFNSVPDGHNMEYYNLVAKGLPEKDRADFLKSA